MLLTIETTHTPATDLGFLLHKSPGELYSAEQPYGSAHIFFPHASAERCQCAVMLEIDPLALVGRKDSAPSQWALGRYVNDRPYCVSSLMSTALNRMLRSAMKGHCAERPELAATPIPLTARLSVLRCAAGADFLRGVFEPLGYSVSVQQHPLDEQFPQWGSGPVFTLELEAHKLLSELLTQLYVLIPVLDDDKHYWVGDDEVAKLLERGKGWLEHHPLREQITRRYLKHQHGLSRSALAQLETAEGEDGVESETRRDQEELALERPLNLHETRLHAVAQVLKDAGAKRVLDLGCGEGALLRILLADSYFTEIAGLDVSSRALALARRRLNYDRLPPRQRERLSLLHGSLTYRDERLRGFEGAALVEVIEHLDAARIEALEACVFGQARPVCITLTTPNAEYNSLFPSLPARQLRHRDHRFEWTRAEFAAWAERVAGEHGYAVNFYPVGPEDAALGAPTQMAVFRR